MEELKELEEGQRAIEYIQIKSSVSSHSQQFLINFINFLVQPCAELDIETKCKLIKENFPDISHVFLQDSEPCSTDIGKTKTRQYILRRLMRNQLLYLVDDCETIFFPNSYSCFPVYSLKVITVLAGSGKYADHFCSLKSDNQDMPMVGLEAMQDANSTLGDFCRSYFMFHDMDVNNPESVFRFMPILSFTESYIYQLDRLNEKIVNLPVGKAGDLKRDFHMQRNESWVNRSIKQFKANPFRPLADLLEHHRLLTERIREEFICGEEYWGLERKLCAALAGNKEILVEDVMRAIHLKSFDYRVLNLLLYQLRGEKVKVNELHMQFLSVSEFLVELSDDLFDYEDDVMENNFNVLRMFVRIHGASVAPTMLAKCITEAEEKYENLFRALGPQLASKYQKRCEEATKEGGKMTGPSLGTWTIPPVIQDEESYRSKLSMSE